MSEDDEGNDESSEKKLALEVVKEAYKNVLEPGLKPVAEAIGTVAGLLNSALAPVALINRKVEIWRQGVEQGMKRKANITDVHVAKAVDTFALIPIAIEEELASAWQNLISSSISSSEYRPVLPKILSELDGSDIRLLKHLIRLTDKGYLISPSVVETDLPQDFYNELGGIDYGRLSVSFTTLEKQSTISTSNNLGAFFLNYHNADIANERVINPTGHQVTPLGHLLFRTCNPQDNNGDVCEQGNSDNPPCEEPPREA